MTLDSRLQRTAGTVYGEIMRNSGITLPNGRYIPGKEFVSELISHGIVTSVSAPEVLKNLYEGVGYGKDDNISTGIQFQVGTFGYLVNPFISGFTSRRIPSARGANYIFNPWKELMKGNFFGTFIGRTLLDRPSVFRALHYNPRKGVEYVRDMYTSFANLPQALQDEFLGILESYPCNVQTQADGRHDPKKWLMPAMDGYYPELDQRLLRVRDEIIKVVPKERQQDVFYILNLLAFHTICIGKGQLIRREIDDLVGYDTTRIPKTWKKGHLDEAVITSERIAELNGFLER